MIARLAIAAAVIAAGVVGIVSLAGGSDSGAGSGTVLAWDEEPLSFVLPTLPDDRIAYGTVRNVGLDRVDASAADFEVRDANGERLEASIQFIGAYAHGIYGAFQQPAQTPEFEQQRLGRTVKLEPGQTRPLTVSYRLTDGAELPATVVYAGTDALPLPEQATDPAALDPDPAR